MADPIRILTDWHGMRGRRVNPPVTAAIIWRQDSLRLAATLISRHELRVWFEPKWSDARWLAKRFPYCGIYSIPVESDTLSRRRIPGWRPRPNNGVV